MTCSPLSILTDPTRRINNLDAFSRQRVSNPESLFDSKLIYDDGSDDFTIEALGGATGGGVYTNQTSSVRLSIGGVSGERKLRQSKRYFNYQSGKSHHIFISGAVGDPVANVSKRVGYFDDNNGFFFEQRGTDGYFLVRRSNVTGVVVETAIPQAAWNLDQLDGVDLTKTALLSVDLQWLGVGAVRMAFTVGGITRYVHEFTDHGGFLDTVYIQTPNLPIRWEIENTAASAGGSIDCICASVMSEGGVDLQGVARGVMRRDNENESIDGDFEPLISVRLSSQYIRSTVVFRNVVAVSTSSANMRIAVLLNANIATPSWQSTYGTGSRMEYDINSNNTLGVGDEGTVLAEAYLSNNVDQVNLDLGKNFALGADYSGTSDVLTLAAQSLGSSETMYGGFNWIEVA